jgi:hypothetical protein
MLILLAKSPANTKMTLLKLGGFQAAFRGNACWRPAPLF